MKQMITIDVDKWKLFEMLCRELDMDFVLDTERKFYIHNGQVYAMETVQNTYTMIEQICLYL